MNESSSSRARATLQRLTPAIRIEEVFGVHEAELFLGHRGPALELELEVVTVKVALVVFSVSSLWGDGRSFRRRRAAPRGIERRTRGRKGRWAGRRKEL